MSVGRLVLVCSLSCLAACGSRPALPDPVAVPAEFSAGGTEPLPQQWWDSLGDTELNAAIQQALGKNFSILQAWDRLAQAEANARKAGAARLPSVNATGSAQRTWPQQGDSFAQYSLGLSASYELDLWGGISSASKAAELDAEASVEQVQAAAVSLSAAVARSWFTLAADYERTRLLRAQVRTNEKIIEVIGAQFAHGQVRAADVFRQRQLLAQTKGRLELAEASLKVQEHGLAVLLGLSPGSQVSQVPPQLRELPPLPQVPLPAAVLERRPDLRSAWLAVRAADQRVQVAVADRYPRLSLGADINSTAENVADLFDDWLVRLTGQLLAPLFDGGRRRAEVDRSEARLRELIHAYGGQVLEAFKEVEDALVQERSQERYLASVNKQLQENAAVLERTRDLYRKGVFDYLRVLEALTSRQNLELEVINARRDVLLRRLDLYRAIAGGWQMSPPQTGERAE